MDKQVQLALAKWPDVPHCYGWLALDARGAWRMRDQHAQELGLPGSKIANATLRSFIDRNYQADEKGRYYFQNGPQRVYVELQSTPYIAHSDPEHGWVLHTGAVLAHCDAVWMLQEGSLVLKSGDILAQIDDRDMFDALKHIYLNGKKGSDEQIIQLLQRDLNKEQNQQNRLTFLFQKKHIPIAWTDMATLARIHPFTAHPKS